MPKRLGPRLHSSPQLDSSSSSLGDIEHVPKGCPRPQERDLALKPGQELVLYRPDGTTLAIRSYENHLRKCEVGFLELEDGAVLELVRNPDDARRIQFAIWKCGDVTYQDRLPLGSETLVVPQRRDALLQKLVLPSGVAPYESAAGLARAVRRALHDCVRLSPRDASLMAAFAVYTWVADRLPVAVYVYITGPPESGKTTLLQVLRLFCRRSLLVCEPSAAGVYSTNAVFLPTLMIDEADFGGRGSSRSLRGLMRAGSSQDQTVLRNGACSDLFGPKAFSSENLPGDWALVSRCIVVSMTDSDEFGTSPLKKPSDPEIVERSQQFQNQALGFRLDMLRKVRPASVPGAEVLPPRRRDILAALAAPFTDDPDWPGLLLKCLEATTEMPVPSLPPPEAAALDALWALCHAGFGQDLVSIKDVVDEIDRAHETGHGVRSNSVAVGIFLKAKLGIEARVHTNKGNAFWLTPRNRLIIHVAARKYGAGNRSELPVSNSAGSCALCEPVLADNEEPRDEDLSAPE